MALRQCWMVAVGVVAVAALCVCGAQGQTPQPTSSAVTPSPSSPAPTPATMASAVFATKRDLDAVFLFFCMVLVFFMQAGFAMLEAGSIGVSGAANVVYKNMLDICLGTMMWWMIGFAFAFGQPRDGGGNGFIGTANFVVNGIPRTSQPIPYSYGFWLFQLMFASASTTIVSGAIAERIRFQGYIVYAVMMMSFTYPVAAHWVWSEDGWLTAFPADDDPFLDVGFLDFAGSGVVHAMGGVASLLGCILLGYRNQYVAAEHAGEHPPRFMRERNGKWRTVSLPASSPVIAALGLFILWVGWFGFNCGSIVNVSGSVGVMERVAVNTMLCSCVAGASTVFLGRFLNRKAASQKWQLDDLMNGLLVGLVSVTGPCAYINSWACYPIGVVGSVLYHIATRLYVRFRIDDVVAAGPVHLVAGMWGVVSCGLFAEQDYLRDVLGDAAGDHYGLLVGGGGKRLGVQLIGLICLLLWSGALNFAIFWGMARFDRDRDSTWFTIRTIATRPEMRFGDVLVSAPTMGFLLPESRLDASHGSGAGDLKPSGSGNKKVMRPSGDRRAVAAGAGVRSRGKGNRGSGGGAQFDAWRPFGMMTDDDSMEGDMRETAIQLVAYQDDSLGADGRGDVLEPVPESPRVMGSDNEEYSGDSIPSDGDHCEDAIVMAHRSKGPSPAGIALVGGDGDSGNDGVDAEGDGYGGGEEGSSSSSVTDSHDEDDLHAHMAGSFPAPVGFGSVALAAISGGGGSTPTTPAKGSGSGSGGDYGGGDFGSVPASSFVDGA